MWFHLALLACAPDARTTHAETAGMAEVVAGLDEFTVDVYQQVAAGADEDVFVSPFSMEAALSMVYAGAAGGTADEMAAVLHVDPTIDHHAALGALIRDLGGDHRRDYTLSVANRLWGQEGEPWKADFLAVNEEDYGAPIVLRDIGGDPEGTRGEVNGWVEDQTHGKIVDLFKPGTISGATRLVVANAIYFKADWAEAFEADRTADGTWTRLDGTTKATPMMHGIVQGRVGAGDGFTAARLPYASDEVSLWVVLPDAVDGLPAVDAALTGAGLRAALDGATEAELDVTLPKFEARTDLDLNAALSALGMPTAFTDAADFSGMIDGGGLYIGTAVHQAYVKVDEQGTEAAAATGIGMDLTSEPSYVTFTADHPFLFVIRDDVTGALLFVGRIVDPRASLGG